MVSMVITLLAILSIWVILYLGQVRSRLASNVHREGLAEDPARRPV
jgi:hypothetical protein